MSAAELEYVDISEPLRDQIKSSWASNAGDHIRLGPGCYAVGAVHAGKPIAVISAFSRPLAEPLADIREAFINIVEVQVLYRRQGIGSTLVGMVVDWARCNELSQVRAWSEEIRVEALRLWQKAGFGFSRVDFEAHGQQRYGFVAVRPLGR
jgi:GNAT superfamily N-acetyltransferase